MRCKLLGLHKWIYSTSGSTRAGNIEIWRECSRCWTVQWWKPITKEWSCDYTLENLKEYGRSSD